MAAALKLLCRKVHGCCQRRSETIFSAGRESAIIYVCSQSISNLWHISLLEFKVKLCLYTVSHRVPIFPCQMPTMELYFSLIQVSAAARPPHDLNIKEQISSLSLIVCFQVLRVSTSQLWFLYNWQNSNDGKKLLQFPINCFQTWLD